LKDVKNFENYIIKQNGEISNKKSKKIVEIEDNRVTLKKKKNKETFKLDRLIEEHFNKIVLKAYFGINQKTKYFRVISEEDSDRLILNNFEVFYCDTKEYKDLFKEKDKDILLEMFKEKFPANFSEYENKLKQAEEAARKKKADEFKAKKLEMLKKSIGGKDYKLLKENEKYIISKNKEILLADTFEKVETKNGRLILKENGRISVLNLEKLYNKYF
jgi:hypothetical protein